MYFKRDPWSKLILTPELTCKNVFIRITSIWAWVYFFLLIKIIMKMIGIMNDNRETYHQKKELMSLKGKVKKIGIFHIWVLTIRVKKWKK